LIHAELPFLAKYLFRKMGFEDKEGWRSSGRRREQ
jgi:hypothetical protein